MTDDDARVGNERLQFCAHGVNRRDAIVQKENLSAAIHFALDRIANDTLVVLRDDGFDRQPIMRWRLNRAHVARAGEREIQRARNRRSAQRQHVHECAQALEFFFMQNAEALFLVNHNESQIFERDVFLNNSMCADDDVHRARSQIFHDFLLLTFACEIAKAIRCALDNPPCARENY